MKKNRQFEFQSGVCVGGGIAIMPHADSLWDLGLAGMLLLIGLIILYLPTTEKGDE